MFSSIILLLSGALSGGIVIWAVRGWADRRMEEVWEVERHEGKKKAKSRVPESAQWLNSMLASF